MEVISQEQMLTNPPRIYLIVYGLVFAIIRGLSAAMSGSLCVLILTSNIKLRTDVSMLLTLNLTIADTIYNGILAIGYTLKWTRYRFQPYGQVTCDIEGFLHIAGTLLSVNTLLWIALERYLVVVREQRKSVKFWILTMAGGWLVCSFLGVLILVLPGGYALRVGGAYCVADWSSRQPARMVGSFAVAGSLGITASAISYIYYAIYCCVRDAQKETAVSTSKTTSRSSARPEPKLSSGLTNSATGTPSALTISKRRNSEKAKPRLDQMVFIKGLTLSVAFIFSWTPYTLLIIMAMCGVEIPPAYDAFSDGFAMLYTYLNCTCLVMLDTRIKALTMARARQLGILLHLLSDHHEKSINA